jgi:hypothetical protein
MTVVVQVSKRTRVERNKHHRVSTVIGCIDTGRAEINLSVEGPVVELRLTALLEEEDRALAAMNALAEGQAHAYVELDRAGLDGLIRLLTQSRRVRRRAACGPKRADGRLGDRVTTAQ